MDNNVHKDLKISLRRDILASRKEIPSVQKARMDADICVSVTTLPEWKKASLILAYASFRGEVDLTPIYLAAEKEGKTIAFPRCLPNRIMEFAACRYRDLKCGRFSIPEPPASICAIKNFPENALCILPCLAVDFSGFRLGYGGGYYDRFLSNHKIISVATLYHRFLLDNTTYTFAEPFDIPADILITEKETIRIEK